MRTITTLLIFGILLSTVSAEIILQQQPNDLYNVGDTINLPVKLTTLTGIQQTFKMLLICNNQQREFYMNDVDLTAGEEISFNPVLRLTKERLGGLTGECRIKAVLGDDYTLTDAFHVSNFINIEFPTDKVEFHPGENIVIQGTAKKESGELVKGFIELSIISASGDISVLDTVPEGFFSINFSIPKTMAAGQYLTNVKVYEKDSNDEITNSGFVDYNILVTQIPTSLEIVLENSDVEPGTSLKVKTILHDQTGVLIKTNSIITIKDKNNIILQQTEKPTDEFLEYPIKYNEAPADWKIFAVSNQLTSESTFKIKEKEDAKIELINKTLIVTNIGNVVYNNTLLIKIGEEVKNLDVVLGIDETQNYVLTAPDGEYAVEVISDGQNKVSQNGVMLTGNAIDVRKAAEGVVAVVRHPLVWIFIIAILGFMAFIVYRKGYQKTFFGYITSKKFTPSANKLAQSERESSAPKNKAELSLSIKGDKQNSSLVCLHIKNLKEISGAESSATDILQKVINLAEDSKASVYDSQGNLFFILAPVTTKTFKNEKPALILAQKIKDVLTEHNKLAKQKINFGISLNYGTIVAKKENGVLKFMSMGTLITGSKKIASIADKDILLGEKIKEKLMADVKTEKKIIGNIPVFSIKEIRKELKEDNLKFIGEFMHRMERF